ncbi:MAG: aspartyl protease family protein [Thermoanaerobaculia bacterium]
MRISRWNVQLALSSCLIFSQPHVTAAGHPIASLPAEMVLNGGILLRARVNGSEPLGLVLDSGAGSRFILDRHRAESLGLELRGRAQSAGAGASSYDVTFASNVRIALAGVAFPSQTVSIISLSPLAPFAGRSLDGVIGFGLFSRYVVEINYAARKVDLYEPQGYRYSGSGIRLPLTMEGNHLYVPAKIAMPGRAAFEGRLMIDTGAMTATVLLNRPTVERHGLLASTGKRILDRSLPGLGGEVSQILSRAATIQLGGLTIRQPTVSLSQDAAGALASPGFDGIIGGELLRRFKVIFDPARRQLILEPNACFAEPYEHNMSGIGLRAEGKDFRTVKIHYVIEESPAAEAGLRKGDVITAINGQPVPSLARLYQMLKQEGREYDLSILRDGKRLQVRLRLRRLA